MAIQLTEQSGKVLQEFMLQEPQPPEFVRFGVKAGGCSGFTYTIDFTDQQTKFDLHFNSHGVSILVDKKSHLYVIGTTIDWSDDLNDKGFKFDNPHAKGACGCRTSFMIDLENIAPTPTPTWMT